jgi:hypothetical protein
MNTVRPYQRRRRGPVTVVVAVLAVATVVTWTVVLTTAGGATGPVACPAPVAAPAPGEVLEPEALAAVDPVAPGAARVTVLNAGGQRGQANLVAAQLADLGFGAAAPPTNDPLFPDGDMECRGQLRFGPAGERAASTLSLVLPCTELVRDGRDDDTVDVVVGTDFADVNPPRPVRDALDRLSNPGVGTDGSTNTADADPDASPPPAPVLSPDALEAARDVTC